MQEKQMRIIIRIEGREGKFVMNNHEKAPTCEGCEMVEWHLDQSLYQYNAYL